MPARSLRLQLLGWLLIPLAGIVLVNTWVTYRNARTTAGILTDRTLLASARSMAEQIKIADHVMEAVIPPSALEMFASKSRDRVYYRIAGSAPDSGEQLIAGYADLPLPPGRVEEFSPSYYDAAFRDQDLRLVAMRQPVADANATRSAMVIVGETLRARETMVRTLWLQGFLQQGLLIVIAAVFAWFGLQRGLRPLLRLRDDVLERRPDELTPFSGKALQAEIRPLVDALNQYIERLRRQSAAQRRFIANAAHQLRTPLTLLSTQATYASRATSGAEKDEALQAIHDNTQQMTRLANQLLTLSRVEPDGQALRLEPVDLVAVARRALESVVALALAREMDLGFETAADTAIVVADATTLQELIINLVDNALRYTPTGGVVTVGIERTENDWLLTVRDNGPGIPDAERERVFERFYRVLGSGTEGSGLGLSIAKPPDGRGLLVAVRLRSSEFSTVTDL